MAESGLPAVRAFLIADVRGYTRFTQTHGDEEAGRLAAAFADLAREVVLACGGEVIELRGDEALCVFGSARQALRGAVELQKRFRSGFALPIGIGLDAGEAVPIEGGYRGAALNTAARLCSVAQPGQILATETVVSLAQKVEGIRFLERRAVRLKGLEKPVRLIEVVPEIPLPPLPEIDVVRRGRPSRRVAALAGVGTAAVVAVVIGVVALRGGGGGAETIAPDAIGTIGSHGVTPVVGLGSAPSALASSAAGIWIVSEDAGTVSRLDPGSDTVNTASLGGTPGGVAVGSGSLWVTNRESRSLVQLNPTTLAQVQTFSVGNGPSGVAVGEGAVWVANAIDGTVSRFDLQRGEVTDTIPIGEAPAGIAVGPGAVWVTLAETGTLVRIDPVSRDVADAVNVGNGPSAVTVGAGAVWVANSRDGTVERIDPAKHAVSGLVTVGVEPTAILAEPDAVWVASSGRLSRIDPETVRITKVIEVGSRPIALTGMNGTIYAATVIPLGGHRGGVLHVESDPSGCRCVDPVRAASESDGYVVGLLYDGLVAYRRAGGVAGSRLVADLALRLPSPTAEDRTYTFQLRPGLRYSDGTAVRASDFRSSIERDLRLNAFSLLRGIADAAACKPNVPCRLIKGLEVDNARRAITIRLSRPDPEFLYKLALPEASIVPGRTPLRPSRPAEIPGTGPYRVASFDPGREIRLARNPRFRVWSAEARPDGYADEIRIHPTAAIAASVARVEHGTADVFSLNFRNLTAPQLHGISARNPATLHSDPQPGTIWLFLNTRVAPFDDVRVRRAVNYAVDRHAFLRLTGGFNTLTCQVLPPDLPGYRPYCPYTRAPNAAGTWSSPDLAKARALVTASGTRGMSVRVIVADAPVPLAVGRYVVRLLGGLGYRSSLRVLTRPKWLPYVADSRNEAQIGLTGWLADRLIPSNLLEPILSCASFVPRSRDNQNVSEYCNPSVDAHIAEAARIEVSDPVRADKLWASLDRTLTDQAPVVPLGNPLGRVLVSGRVGNYENHPLLGPLLDQLWVK